MRKALATALLTVLALGGLYGARVLAQQAAEEPPARETAAEEAPVDAVVTGEAPAAEEFDFFSDKINACFQLRQHTQQGVPCRINFLCQLAPELALRHGQARGGLCANRIKHRFCLGQIESAIEKRTLGKLSRSRQSGARGNAGPTHQGQDEPSSV